MSDTPQCRDDEAAGMGMPNATPPAVGLVDGPEFVVAPPHRLFAVFEESASAIEAIKLLTTESIVTTDVWVYAGEKAAQAMEPAIAKHGPGIALVRLAQRLLTNDCEYCELLSKSLHGHAMVIAIEVEHPSIDAARAVLAEHGGHSFAYGEHWNFVSVDNAAFEARHHEEGSTGSEA